MRRIVIAIAAAGIVAGAAACSASNSPPATGQRSGQRSSGSGDVRGTWTVASCQVDVTYVDYTTTVDYYVPDTDANFQQHGAASNSSGAAGLAVVITLVNNTGGPAPLPTDLVVSFTDRSGKDVGHPQTVNNANGTGYGPAIAHGHGSGEAFSASTVFSSGQTVAESPDIGASVPPQPDLRCQVHRP